MTSKTRSNNRNNTELTDAELDHVYGGGGQSGWVNTAAGAIMAVNAPWTNQGISNVVAAVDALELHFSPNALYA